MCVGLWALITCELEKKKKKRHPAVYISQLNIIRTHIDRLVFIIEFPDFGNEKILGKPGGMDSLGLAH